MLRSINKHFCVGGDLESGAACAAGGAPAARVYDTTHRCPCPDLADTARRDVHRSGLSWRLPLPSHTTPYGSGQRSVITYQRRQIFLTRQTQQPLRLRIVWAAQVRLSGSQITTSSRGAFCTAAPLPLPSAHWR